jgi:hypothetical protein
LEKSSMCIYFSFAIHLRIAGSVAFDDVVLMGRLRFNTPCFQQEPEALGVLLHGESGKLMSESSMAFRRRTWEHCQMDKLPS